MVIFAILAGVAVGLAEITYFLVFSKGVSASVAIPVVLGGTILLGSILGIIFLQENFAGVKPRPYRAKFSVPKTRHSSEERKAAWL